MASEGQDMLLAIIGPTLSIIILVAIPWITFKLSRLLPRWSFRFTICLLLLASPVVFLHVYFTYGSALRRTPGLETLPTMLGWGVPITALMAFGAFLALFPNWAVARIGYGLSSIVSFGKPSYYDQGRYRD
jgi:hypothetical protein